MCDIKIRRAPKRHDTIDFQPIIENISEIVPVSVVVADKGYDSEQNHVIVRDALLHNSFKQSIFILLLLI
jgi:hypothetical protein